MSWFEITHDTVYRYRNAVNFAPHRLVLRPREGHDIHVEQMKLSITPEYELAWSRDVFSNSVATVHFLEPSDELRITSKITLHQTLDFPRPGLRGRKEPVPFPVEYPPIESVIADAYGRSVFPEDTEIVTAWLAQHLDLKACTEAETAANLLNDAVRTHIGYQRREVRGVQSPAETIRLGTGSCRDLATLLMEAYRLIGFPSRFVSGYLDCSASEAGHASTHAWTEVYLPEIGWIGFDPTVGEETHCRHVVVGVSNHPRGVMPIVGSYYGSPAEFIDMTVAVHTARSAKPMLAGTFEQ